MALDADQQAACIALLRQKIQSAQRAIQAMGDGDSQRDALYALSNCTKETDALEKNAERRLGQTGPVGVYADGPTMWLHDARELEQLIGTLPADAQQGTLEDVLRQTGKATVQDVADGAGKVIDAAGGAVGFTVGAFWGAMPWWAKGVVIAGGVGAVAFVGWQVYQVATSAKRVAAVVG